MRRAHATHFGHHIRGLEQDALTHLDRVLLALWQVVAQGPVRLDPEVRTRLWHLVARCHDLVRSQHTPQVPAALSPGPA